ncbi:MAG: acyl-CoA dehydrogenase family protein, partial [Nocardioides sp.]|nr:acyl-CoA dehydrogenase family protein [Nocardioides sp.]
MSQGVPVLTSAEAVAAARTLAEDFAEGAAERDRSRTLPYDQVKALAASGLLAITVPEEHGGADLPVETLVEVFRLLGWGDPNIAQIPHSHFVYLNQLRLRGTHDQQARIYAEVLRGKAVANAQSEFGTKHVRDFKTTLTPDGEGTWRLNGDKFYCTGSLFADY